jgi:hypothetical protein
METDGKAKEGLGFRRGGGGGFAERRGRVERRRGGRRAEKKVAGGRDLTENTKTRRNISYD